MQTMSGKVAQKYCKDHPSVPTRTLASKLCREQPELYENIDKARHFVRYYRGECGKGNRSGAKKVVETTKDRFGIPESDAVDIAPYDMKVKGRGMVMSDLHIPYHSVEAIRQSLEYVELHGYTDFLIINGDMLDCYQLSRWNKDPRNRAFGLELDLAKEFLQAMANMFGKVIYKLGNHEKRYEDYLIRQAPALIGITNFELSNVLEIDKLGIDLVNHNRVIHAGALNILHGHEYGQSVFNPVNPARGMFLRAKSCTLSGHSHQTSEHNEGNIRRKITSCWTTGCLCGLSPEYAPLNKWDHGFATMEYDGDKWFEVDTHRIIEGRVT